jgi:pullulanase/glycogen debranching enzyme
MAMATAVSRAGSVKVLPGVPYPLGAAFDGSGTNFAVFSEVAERIELCLFDDACFDWSGEHSPRTPLEETIIHEMHVDGFRFDLAAARARELKDVDRLSALFEIIHQDPVINQVQLALHGDEKAWQIVLTRRNEPLRKGPLDI